MDYVLVIVITFISAFTAGGSVEGNSWKTDCSLAGVHVYHGVVFECKEKK